MCKNTVYNCIQVFIEVLLMKKLKILCFLLSFLLIFNFGACNGETSNNKLSSEQIYSMAKGCAVEIITYNKNNQELSLGSGFTYSNDGKIVTNYHVIDEAYFAKVYIEQNSYDVVSVLAYDIEKDLAVLKINATNLKTLKINYSAPATGSTIFALGSSRGLTSTFSSGIVTSSSREIDGVNYIQHDAAISNGNSGGPLINGNGEIIGINTLTIKDSQNLNFAISTIELNSLSFSTPLSLAQVYEKENDAFTKLANFIVKNGEYDYEDNNYYYFAGIDTSDGIIFSRSAFYYPSTKEITLTLLVDYELFFSITFSKNSTIYSYALLDSEYESYMFGNLYPNSFSSYTTYLNYTSTNIYYSSTITAYKELSASCAKLLITCINLDYSSIGITAYDLGFKNF